MQFIKKFKIINENQFGFQQVKSCKNALISFTEFLRNSVDQSLKGLACFIDLKKAFDTICHKTKIKKLEKYGFRGNFLNLMKSFLENRHQYVEYNNSVSQKLKINYGVPQESVLGPLFFLLYINDLPGVCKSNKITLFADDTTIYSAAKQNTSFSYNEVKETKRWFEEHKLTINDKKCSFINFGKREYLNKDFLVKNVQNVNKITYLGIIIDHKLNYNSHVEKIAKQMSKFCGVLYKAGYYFTKNQLLLFYESYAKSVITYGLIVYGCTTKTNLNEIFILQKRIFRAIFLNEKLIPFNQ